MSAGVSARLLMGENSLGAEREMSSLSPEPACFLQSVQVKRQPDGPYGYWLFPAWRYNRDSQGT